MDINPIDKVDELLEMLQQFNPTVKRITDRGYEWMEEETDICIEILNPNSDNPDDGLLIICEDNGEFTLGFGDMHEHYNACSNEYKEMCKTTLDILNNKLCSVVFLLGDEKTWIASSYITVDEISNPLSAVFGCSWQKEYFADKIKSGDCEAHCHFWDSSLNEIIKVQ